MNWYRYHDSINVLHFCVQQHLSFSHGCIVLGCSNFAAERTFSDITLIHAKSHSFTLRFAMFGPLVGVQTNHYLRISTLAQ